MRWRLMMSRIVRSRRRKMMMLRMMMLRMTMLTPKTGPTLWASLRSRNARPTFHKSHFIRKFTGKMLRPRAYDHTLCEPAQSTCISSFRKSHFTRKIFSKNAGAQNLGPHCARACAVEIHLTLRKSHFIPKLTGKMPRRRLCGSLRSRNAFEHFTKAALNGNSQDKCCAPEWAQNADGLCASLRSLNVLGDFTRATFYRNLQEKYGPAGAPWSSTGLYNCSKNP